MFQVKAFSGHGIFLKGWLWLRSPVLQQPPEVRRSWSAKVYLIAVHVDEAYVAVETYHVESIAQLDELFLQALRGGVPHCPTSPTG